MKRRNLKQYGKKEKKEMLQEYIQIQKRMNTAGIAKESNNEIPNMKENCWTQDKEKRHDPEQESYVKY